MIKGLPNINIYILNNDKDEKEEEEDDTPLLKKMLKKKDKKQEEMLKIMKEMKDETKIINMKTGGTSHVGGG